MTYVHHEQQQHIELEIKSISWFWHFIILLFYYFCYFSFYSFSTIYSFLTLPLFSTLPLLLFSSFLIIFLHHTSYFRFSSLNFYYKLYPIFAHLFLHFHFSTIGCSVLVLRWRTGSEQMVQFTGVCRSAWSAGQGEGSEDTSRWECERRDEWMSDWVRNRLTE